MVETIGIVGAGLMGTGIAQVAILSGLRTILVRGRGGDPSPARQKIVDSMHRAVARGKLDGGTAEAALRHLEVASEVAAVAEASMIIESVVEDLATKRALVEELAPAIGANTILATNTSTLKVADIAPKGAIDRTVALHFFSPVPAMKLVEVAHLPQTRPEILERATSFVEAIGKTPVPVLDSTGFIVNRLLVPYLLGAMDAFERGLAPAPQIDVAMKLGCAHPVGPLALADRIGLDIVLAMGNLLYEEFQHARFEAPPVLEKLVAAGRLGFKSKRGFYLYEGGDSHPDEELWAHVRGDFREPL